MSKNFLLAEILVVLVLRIHYHLEKKIVFSKVNIFSIFTCVFKFSAVQIRGPKVVGKSKESQKTCLNLPPNRTTRLPRGFGGLVLHSSSEYSYFILIQNVCFFQRSKFGAKKWSANQESHKRLAWIRPPTEKQGRPRGRGCRGRNREYQSLQRNPERAFE